MRDGGLGGRSAAARTDTDDAAWLTGLRCMDHDHRAAPRWRGGVDRTRDLSDAFWLRDLARSIRHSGLRSGRGYLCAVPLYGRNDHTASAADTSTMVDCHAGQPSAFFVISVCGVNLVSLRMNWEVIDGK